MCSRSGEAKVSLILGGSSNDCNEMVNHWETARYATKQRYEAKRSYRHELMHAPEPSVWRRSKAHPGPPPLNGYARCASSHAGNIAHSKLAKFGLLKAAKVQRHAIEKSCDDKQTGQP